ncbi:1-phosphofructokinase family hexose kinase [Miniphocaeibacter halophilus]|uniref:1-phosphofructokinase family hexose kinase n=1 Tax=Miniphocaeibacter halophilus TaxID=2931922 RepID=A0AC61MX05_9FIRM|nr:1-phosphofructokinase family hexose kinase [Miniphocaeibacter halophilus]QQK08550.1 1-phosphofructokinase family hexose kinase [Miniphocaeibacter halophilus]
MIYTVTLNPSMDLLVEIDGIEPNITNRMNNDLRVPGGKSINVARVLRRLGMPSVATGFIGGYTGEFVKDWLKMEDINTSFIEIDDETRINIKLLNQNIVINGRGPNVSINEETEFLYFMSRIQEGDTVIMMGTMPPSLDDDLQDRIISICKANKAEFIVDAEPKQLKEFIKRGPLLIKPNLSDVEKMFNVKLDTRELIVEYGFKLLELGAKHAIISVGEKGAYLFSGGHAFKGEGVKGKEVRSEGVRDAMIAGFIATYIRTSNLEESFKVAMASATATAFSKDLAKRHQIEDVLDKIIVQKLI